MARKLDRFDLEAEREGNAIKKEFRIKRPLGKRIMAIRRGHASGATMIQTKVEKRYVK